MTSAVATKPRAKSAQKPQVKPATTHPTLESVRADIAAAVTILEGVLSTSDYGGAMHAVVRMVIDEKMPLALRLLDQTPLCREDIQGTYESLFPVLHLLEGATALAPGEAGGIFEQPLTNARAIFNVAHNRLDSAGPIAQSLPDVDCKARAFMSGKSLLAAMLERALATESGGASSMFAAYRSDTEFVEQADFVKADLLRLVEDPSLIDGYSAALCEVLSEATLDGVTSDCITAATFEACRHAPIPFDPHALDVDSAGKLARSLSDHAPAALPHAGPNSTAAGRPVWSEIDLANGELGAAAILAEIAHEECQWQFTDPDASGAAQERLCVLLSAMRDKMGSAQRMLDDLVNDKVEA